MENNIEVTFCGGFLVIGMDLDGVGYSNSQKLIFSSILVWWTTKLRLLPRTFARLVVNESGSIQCFVTRKGDPRWLSLGKVSRDLCIITTVVHLVNFNIKMILNLNVVVLLGCHQVNGLWENASGRYVRKCGQASICKSGNGFVKVENVPLVATMTTTMSANKRSTSSFTASIFILNTQHCCWIPSPLLGILTALISQIWISII